MSAAAEILQSPEQNQFSSILKHAPVGLALCQSPGNLTSTNSTFEELLGLTSNRVPCFLPELIQDGDESRRLIAELFQGTRESFQMECAAWGAESKSLRWTVWAVHGEGSGTESAVVMIEDLSGMALARQRLQQTER
jgi:PAS domain S-box-containing protein